MTGKLLEEYDTNSVRTAAYLQGAHGVIKSLLNNIYYYQDKLGSTTHIANSSDALLESYRYDLYGTPSYYDALNNQLSTSNYSVNDLYAGERWIVELAAYDLRNRFMSPELGRFLQADPIGFKGDASNLYRYCHNDPEDFTDPMGLNPPDWNWSHLMYWTGNSPLSFNAIFLAQMNQPAGNQSPAIAPKDEGAKVHFAPASNPVYHQDDVYRNNKDGSTTKVVSKTTAELEVTADSAKEATVKLTVREYYAKSAGPRSRDFAAKHEHKDNAQPILDWYRLGSTQLKAMQAVRQHFDSKDALSHAVDRAIRPGFDFERTTHQWSADVVGLHNPRDERGNLIPYEQ